jgi:cyclopropane-fatty-acyl-phospholipid synthase
MTGSEVKEFTARPRRGSEARARHRKEAKRNTVSAVHTVAAALGAAGARLVVDAPGTPPLRVGAPPERARVVFQTAGALAPLARRDLTGLAEAYLRGEIDVEGDFLEAVKITEVLAPGPTRRERLAFALRLLLRDRRGLQRESAAFHYDRPAGFFLPWLERWRSYSHGLYLSPDEPPDAAQARKLERAIAALGLAPGMRVLDMGCGWGSFLEYAGSRGIRVHGITLSREQHAFCTRLVRERELPCTVEHVDFLDWQPPGPLDGAVFMGTFEHFADHRFTARFLARHLAPGARVWADFCTARDGRQVGAFLARHVFPGTATYVDVPGLLAALADAGLHVWELADDTRSYELSCRGWADALDREGKGLAERFGEPAVRAFRVYLRASQHFFATGRTQAFHLVAAREPAPLPLSARA